VKPTEHQIPDKLYFRIGEVSDIVGVKPYVLRYWESEFTDINPTKSKSGQRLYKRKDVELLLNIRRLLYEERFTINGARKRLKELSRSDLAGHEVHSEHGETQYVPPTEEMPRQLDVFAHETANPGANPGVARMQTPTQTQENRKILLKIKKDLESVLRDLHE